MTLKLKIGNIELEYSEPTTTTEYWALIKDNKHKIFVDNVVQLLTIMADKHKEINKQE